MLLTCSGTEYASPFLIWWGGHSKEMLEENKTKTQQGKFCSSVSDVKGFRWLC